MPYAIALIAVLALQTPSNWPHWRGPSHDGNSKETGLPSSWGAKCLDGTGVQPASDAQARQRHRRKAGVEAVGERDGQF